MTNERTQEEYNDRAERLHILAAPRSPFLHARELLFRTYDCETSSYDLGTLRTVLLLACLPEPLAPELTDAVYGEQVSNLLYLIARKSSAESLVEWVHKSIEHPDVVYLRQLIRIGSLHVAGREGDVENLRHYYREHSPLRRAICRYFSEAYTPLRYLLKYEKDLMARIRYSLRGKVMNTKQTTELLPDLLS